MNKYIIEQKQYISTHWKLHFEFNKKDFDEEDRIEINRTDGYGRVFDLIILKNSISYSSRGISHEFQHNVDFNLNNNYCNIIWRSFECCELDINGNIYNLGEIYSSCDSYIESSVEIYNYSIKYLNFNSEIPRVYGDCFVNLHTHKMFGRWCYDLGANYYNFGRPHIPIEEICKKIIEDYHKCPNNHIFLFLKSYIRTQYAKRTFSNMIKLLREGNIPLKSITFCTMPHVNLENTKTWNMLIKTTSQNYIDFNKDFENLKDINDYFEDEAHTNESGGEILFNRVKKDAPELLKKYTLNE